jgi:ABC-2 type transport system permease protein
MNKLIIANFKQFLRDKTAVFFTFAFPLIFIFLFGMVFSGTDDLNYNIRLVVEDDSHIAQGLNEAFSSVPIFTISEGELDASLDTLKNGDLTAVIQIPANIEETIGTGGTAALTIYHDPSQTQTAQIILPVVRQIVDEFNRQLTQAPILITVSEESILADSFRFIDFFVPGILAMSIMQSGLFGILPLVEWREKKVLKRLGVTPLSRSTVVISQLVFRLVLAVIQAAILLGIAYAVFGVPIMGSIFLLLGLVVLGTLVFISLGYVVAARVKTVEGATPIVNLISFPMMFLSGVFFPVDMMPEFIRPVITAMPLTYLADSFRQVMVESAPLYPLSTDILVLLGWLVVCLILTIRFFKWE